jgi:hypothetical protein
VQAGLRSHPARRREFYVYSSHRNAGIVIFVLELALFGVPGIIMISVQMLAMRCSQSSTTQDACVNDNCWDTGPGTEFRGNRAARVCAHSEAHHT